MSEQIVNYTKQHQKLVIVAIIAIIVIIVSLIVTFILTSKKNESSETNEIVLNDLLKDLGSDFYEQFFYVQAGKNSKDRKKFVAKYKETGITTTLDNINKSISGLEDKIREFKNSVTDEECDKDKTQVKIIPKEPYDVKDYELEITLVCGF